MAEGPGEASAEVLTRRQFLYVVGGTVFVSATGGLLAACTTTSSGSPPTGAPTLPPASVAISSVAGTVLPTPVATGIANCPVVTPSTTKVGGAFNLFTWAGYDGKDVAAMKDGFYAKDGIDLNVKYIGNEVANFEAYMNSVAGHGWDASSNGGGDCEHGYALGVQSPISDEEVPALAKMYGTFKDGSFWNICDHVYNSVPWTWGPLGINTRPERVPADALKSYDGLFDVTYKGRIGTYDDAWNMIAVGAVATRNDPALLTRDQLNGPVKEWLAKLKPQLKVLSTSIGDQANLLASGDVDIELVGLLWFIPQVKSQGVTIDFRVPDEGTYGFVDSVIITPWAKNRQNAIAYANALIQGDTAIAMQESTFQMSTNPEVNAKLSADVRGLYPKDLEGYLNNTLKWNKAWWDPNGQYATLAEWSKVWDDVKAGA